jgi:hypothetical protein
MRAAFMHSAFIKDGRGHSAQPERWLGVAAFPRLGIGKSMQSETRIYSLPRWRVTRWLADCGPGVPDDIRVALIGNLFGGLPIFASGVINTLAVALVIALRKPAAPFIAWLVFEFAV